MKKNVRYVLFAFLTVFGLVSCDESDYEYTAPEVETGAQVYFPVSNPSSMDLKSLAGSFVVPITRVDTTQAMTVNLVAEATSQNYTVPQSVSFAAGQAEAKLSIQYKDLQYDVTDTIRIKVDESASSSYGISEYVFTVSCPAPWTPWCSTVSEWEACGMSSEAWPLSKTASTCTYTYCIYWDGDDQGLPIYYRQSTIDATQGQFRITNWGAGGDLIVEYNSATGACQVLPQYVVDHSTYGPVYISDIPHHSAQYTYEQFPCFYNKESGKFELSVVWYVDAGMFGNDVETIQVDGFYVPDYSISALFEGTLTDASQTTFALLNLQEIGPDVEAVKALVVAKDDDAAAVADAIAAGDVECDDLVLGNNKLSLNDLTGELKLVVVSLAEGEVKNINVFNFEYYGGGSANPWVSLGMGLYTDAFVAPMFGIEVPTYEVEIMENTENPGLYRVMNPYSNSVYPYAEDDCAADGLYLEIDAKDPNGVYIQLQDLGFDWGYGPMAVCSWGAYLMANGYGFDEVKAEGLLGTLKDGVITLATMSRDTDKGTSYYQGLLFMGEDGYYAGGNDLFRVVLPADNGIVVKAPALMKTKPARRMVGQKARKLEKAAACRTLKTGLSM